jgi:hypothetical protein
MQVEVQDTSASDCAAAILCHFSSMETVGSGQSSVVSSEPKPAAADKPAPKSLPKEIGGPPGPEPTRYGDWQFNGRVTDF